MKANICNLKYQITKTLYQKGMKAANHATFINNSLNAEFYLHDSTEIIFLTRFSLS